MVGTAIVFEALRRVRPHAKIIVAGSSAEYGFVDPSEVPINERRELRPLHPYGVSKAATDMLAYQYHKSYGMHTVVARIFNCSHAKSEMHFPISSAVVHGWSTIRNKVPSGWEILRRNGLSWTSAISIGR